MLTPGIGPRTLFRILAKLQRRQETIKDFFGLDDAELRREFGMREASITALHKNDDVVDDYLKTLNEKNVQMLAYDQPEYPQKLCKSLGEKAPPLLFYWGNLDLLGLCAVGFSGSRDTSVQGLNVVKDTVRQLAQAGINIVSGHARGTDLAAHKAALAAGGKTTIVIPEGILAFEMRSDLRKVVEKERVLVLSQFSPRFPWRSYNAMTRNDTICGLSDAIVLIESKKEGGTFAAGQSALRMQKPLFVVEYADPTESASGNTYFIDHGAIPLRRTRGTEQANVEPILKTILGCTQKEENDEHGERTSEDLDNLNISHVQSSMF
jgi:DNA processing protein